MVFLIELSFDSTNVIASFAILNLAASPNLDPFLRRLDGLLELSFCFREIRPPSRRECIFPFGRIDKGCNAENLRSLDDI